MKPHKKGKQWEIVYRVPGYDKVYAERFASETEAWMRIKEIEYAKLDGSLTPPVQTTGEKAVALMSVSEYMDYYVMIYGRNWSPSYYTCSVHRITDYIKPLIGEIKVKNVTTRDIDNLYLALETYPAVRMEGHKEAQTVSPAVIEAIHTLLHAAFGKLAVLIHRDYNPVDGATVPHPRNKRTVWDIDQSKQALAYAEEHMYVLYVCMMLAIALSARIGEILALTWEDVHIDPSLDESKCWINITKTLQRCAKDALETRSAVASDDIYLVFPDSIENAKSSLVLKKVKTQSSVRRVYLPASISMMLIDHKIKQTDNKSLLGNEYNDYDLVIAFPNGRPVAERYISDKMASLCEATGLPKAVFHSLRATSASVKLVLMRGDIKTVQADTGQSNADTLINIYGRSFPESQIRMAKVFDEEFFKK